jgi:tetratricopeptide (TPR) repeat protein
VARQLGGSRLLLGSVVGSRASLVVNATLLGLPDGDLRAQASAGGPVDSLTTIVDRLVARLLAKEAGEWDRLANRTSTSVPALRAFLDGQAAYRRGSYRIAIREFKSALERDPSFAMAGLALAAAADRIDALDDRARGLTAAWAARAELTVRDSIYLHALAGPRYPASSSIREQINEWERAVAVAPERAEFWHELGKRLFYDGRLLGIREWQTRATSAFQRAAQLDPSFASPLQYLLQLAAVQRDSGGVRSVSAAYLKLDSTGDLAHFVKWRSALTLSDSAAIHRVRRGITAMPQASLRAIILSSQYVGENLSDAQRALDALSSRAVRASDRAEIILARHAIALNRGRPDDALEATEQLADDRSRLRLALRLRVLDHLYGKGDSITAVAAVARLTNSSNSEASADDECVLDQWRAWAIPRGEHDGKAPPRSPMRSDDLSSAAAPCIALRDAVAAVRSGSANAPIFVAQFDSVMQVDDLGQDMPHYAGLALARLYDELGETNRALAAVRKRPHMWPWPRYLATQLYLEGRLATAASDTTGAVRAYQHFLALQGYSENASAEVAEARAQIQRLTVSNNRSTR